MLRYLQCFLVYFSFSQALFTILFKILVIVLKILLSGNPLILNP